MEPDWVTTSTLLVRLRDFDDDAWARFAERFRRPILAFARGQGLAEADAEDAAQETLLAFARAYRERRYDPRVGRLSRWLFGIAHRQVLRARARLARGRARDGRHAASDFWEEVPEAAASAAWDRDWERCVLQRCIELARSETAPATFRAFELVVREQHTPAEAARELDLPVKAVYNAKHRVLKRVRELREQLESAG